MSKTPHDIPIISSVSEIAEGYDAWFCDIWGVIHNGESAHRAAVAACHTFRKRGGVVILITNAPRPAPSVIRQLAGLGVTDATFDAVVTSGDVTRTLIAEWSGRPAYHLGPERDLPIFEGLDVAFSSAEEAEVVVNTGLFDDIVETPADYEAALAGFKARGLPMICANPDIVVERGREISYCAGALAERYREMGGTVAYAGKPYAPIYDVCCKHFAEIKGAPAEKNKILAIGDGLKTDMRGALQYGIDALFIPSGVHVTHGTALDPTLLGSLFNDQPMRPVAAIDGLKW